MGHHTGFQNPAELGINVSLLLISKRASPFLPINKKEMDLGGIELDVLSKLLQGVEKLENFTLTSSSDTLFEYRRLNRELDDALKVYYRC